MADTAAADVCSFGAQGSVDNFQVDKGNTGSKRSCRSPFAFVCKNCQRRACKPCARDILNLIPPAYRVEDAWCIEIESSFAHHPYNQDIFLDSCHSCELKYFKLDKNDDLPQKQKKEVPVTQPKRLRRKRKKERMLARKNKKKFFNQLDAPPKQLYLGPETRYSGYLHLLGCNLLIDSPINGDIDIHGMGFVKGSSSGVYHCCLSHDTSIRLKKNNIFGIPMSTFRQQCPQQCEILEIQVQKPYSPQPQVFKCELITVPVYPPTEQDACVLKGTNNPSDEEISKCYVFDRASRLNESIDCTIITGRMPEANGESEPLLLLRFHALEDYSNTFAEEFYEAVKNRVGKNGWEVRRTGGSGGVTTNPYSDKLLQFLKSLSISTPRKSYACKIIQLRTKYIIYYVSSRNASRKVTKVEYTPPQRGGKFSITPSTFVAVPFLQHFAECKLVSALMIDELNNLKDRKVALESVKQELVHIGEAGVIGSMCPEGVSARLVTLTVYNSFNFHTIVTYNVGYHLDRFHQGVASLENKAVFKIDRYSREKKLDSGALSRGGGKYLGEFYYALLDWNTNARSRRRVAIRMGIITDDQHLTQARMDEYLTQNPDQRAAFEAAVNAERLNNNNNGGGGDGGGGDGGGNGQGHGEGDRDGEHALRESEESKEIEVERKDGEDSEGGKLEIGLFDSGDDTDGQLENDDNESDGDGIAEEMENDRSNSKIYQFYVGKKKHEFTRSEYRKVRYVRKEGGLGLTIVNVFRYQGGNRYSAGVKITKVNEDSQVKALFKKGDVLYKIGDQKVLNTTMLKNILAVVGDEMVLKYFSRGKETD